MKSVLILFFIVIISACGTKKDRITGEWRLISYESNQKINNPEEYRKALSQLIKTTSIEFFEDNTFKGTIWNDTAFGNWQLHNNNLIVTDLAGKNSFTVKIKELGNTNMTLEEKKGDFIARMYFEKE